MSVVYASTRLANVAMPELGAIDAHALVDTGAMSRCVPQHVSNQLRLEQFYEREVIYADGRSELVPYCGGVRAETKGRGCVTGAPVFGTHVLRGALPMEDMDLVLHPKTQQPLPNPDNPNIAVSPAMGFRASHA